VLIEWLMISGQLAAALSWGPANLCSSASHNFLLGF